MNDLLEWLTPERILGIVVGVAIAAIPLLIYLKFRKSGETGWVRVWGNDGQFLGVVKAGTPKRPEPKTLEGKTVKPRRFRSR